MSNASMPLTPEQEERHWVLFRLHEVMRVAWASSVPSARTLWVSLADENLNGLDIGKLVDDGWLERTGEIYTPVGNWQDDYPPYAYRLTQKAFGVLANTLKWVRTGESEAQS